jgi:hypothetical protein
VSGYSRWNTLTTIGNSADRIIGGREKRMIAGGVRGVRRHGG